MASRESKESVMSRSFLSLLAFVVGLSTAYSQEAKEAPAADPVVWRFGTTEDYRGPITGLAFSRDGATLAVGVDNVVHLWDVKAWKKICEFAHAERVHALTF